MEQYVDCLYVFSFLLLGEEQSATPNKRHRRISRKISTRRGQEAVTPICILLFFAGSSECGHHLVWIEIAKHTLGSLPQKRLTVTVPFSSQRKF